MLHGAMAELHAGDGSREATGAYLCAVFCAAARLRHNAKSVSAAFPVSSPLFWLRPFDWNSSRFVSDSDFFALRRCPS
jgi:hypothetical protein